MFSILYYNYITAIHDDSWIAYWSPRNLLGLGNDESTARWWVCRKRFRRGRNIEFWENLKNEVTTLQHTQSGARLKAIGEKYDMTKGRQSTAINKKTSKNQTRDAVDAGGSAVDEMQWTRPYPNMWMRASRSFHSEHPYSQVSSRTYNTRYYNDGSGNCRAHHKRSVELEWSVDVLSTLADSR